MNRLINLLLINIPKKKTIYILIIISSIYTISNFYNFLYLNNNRGNYYDYITGTFGSQFVVSYFLFIIYIILISNISMKKEFNKYVMCRFKSLKDWYNDTILIILIISIIFVGFIFIVCTLESSITLDFSNKWSEYFISLKNNDVMLIYNKKNVEFLIDNVKPMKYILINLIYIVLYFFTFGNILFNTTIIFKKKWMSLTSVLIINIVDIAISRSELTIKKFGFLGNVLTMNKDFTYMSALYTPFIYWIILNVSIYIIGRLIINRIDFQFGDDL
ncbi:hypothetical protein JCM1393_19610 [Clostridium carnis]